MPWDDELKKEYTNVKKNYPNDALKYFPNKLLDTSYISQEDS